MYVAVHQPMKVSKLMRKKENPSKHPFPRPVIAWILVFCVIQTACSAIAPPSQSSPGGNNTPNPPVQTPTQMNDFQIVAANKSAFEYDFAEFNIGSGVYQSKTSAHQMPYEIRGIMAVPKGAGPFPIVLISHGNHEELDQSKRLDTGFDYLVKGLAEKGYIAISMDMLKPYIQSFGGNDDYIEKMTAVANDHIDGLLAANGGNSGLFPIDLVGKIDFDRLALIGHSRSGAAIFQIGAELLSKDLTVKSYLSLAPAADFWARFQDASIAFLVPQYDGDVIQLDGIFMFDYLAGRFKGDHSLTVLMGANHNFFNRNIERDDSSSHQAENGHPPMTREEQEAFLVNFATAFLDSSLGQRDSFYLTGQPQPNKMFGHYVNRVLRMNGSLDLIKPDSTAGFTALGASVRHAVDSVFYNSDELLVNTATTSILKTILDGTFDKEDDTFEYLAVNRDLIVIEWTNNNSSVKITPSISDFSSSRSLTIHIIPDSASELNKQGEALRFSILLCDSSGNSASISCAPGQMALTPYAGKHEKTVISDDFIIEYWSPTTPMGMLNIPLSSFNGVDLSSIMSVELIFDQSTNGSLFLGGIQLQ